MSIVQTITVTDREFATEMKAQLERMTDYRGYLVERLAALDTLIDATRDVIPLYERQPGSSQLAGKEAPSGRMTAPASAAPFGDGAANPEKGGRPPIGSSTGGSHVDAAPRSKAEEAPAESRSNSAGVRLKKTEAALLDCIRREGPRVTNAMLAAVAQVHINTIINTVERLKQRGVLEQDGSRNGRRLYIAGEPRPADRPVDGTLAAKLLDALREAGPDASNKTLGDAIDRPPHQVAVILNGLETAGKIRRVGSTRSRSVFIVGETDGAVNMAVAPVQRPGAHKPRQPKRRFTEHAEFDPEKVSGLASDHPAVTEGRTLFPTTVIAPSSSRALLKSGEHSRKIGDRVTKGPWAGFPIYTLTLEERATCPRSCAVYLECYGNGMPLADRHEHGPKLEATLEAELAQRQARHSGGFVVRLHVLGDFYSVDYVARWSEWLTSYPALRVYGYTAWPESSEIGKAVAELREACWDRFAVRKSVKAEAGAAGPLAVTLKRKARGREPEGIVCPAQTEADVCCGSCGLCWSPEMRQTPIAFMIHGRKMKGAKPAVASGSQDKPQAANPGHLKPKPAALPKPDPKAMKPWPAEIRSAEPEIEKWPRDRRCDDCGKTFRAENAYRVRCGACRKPKPVPRQAVPTPSRDAAAVERFIAEKGVQRYEPGDSTMLYVGCPLVVYLGFKGHKVGAIVVPSGRLRGRPASVEIDGKKRTHAEAVEIANKHRAADGLAPLPVPSAETRGRAA